MLGPVTKSILTNSTFQMGFRYGLELRPAVACLSPSRNHRRIDHHRILGRLERHQPNSVGHDLLRRHHSDQSVRC